MSRIIIKNLPSYISDTRLREVLSAARTKGGTGWTITDIKLLHKQRDGASRRFGFVGFKSEAEATAAKEYFDRSYIDTSKISVEIVTSRDGPPPKRRRLEERERSTSDSASAPRPASDKLKPPKATSTSLPLVSLKKDDESKDKKTKPPLADQFMQVMQPRTNKGRSWANEDAMVTLAPAVLPSKMDPPTVTATPTPKLNETTEKKGKKVKPVDDEHRAEPSTNTKVLPTDNDDKDDHPNYGDMEMSDLEWMKRRMQRGIDDNAPDLTGEVKVFEQSDEDEEMKEDKEPKSKPISEEKKNETEELSPSESAIQTIRSTKRIFLRNLPFSCKSEDLEEAFRSFGAIEQVHIPLDSLKKTSKGVAYITFSSDDSAIAAFQTMDGKVFQGRLLHILPAVDRRGAPNLEEGETKKKSLKETKREKRKEGAGKEFNWAMLYMNSDAVLSSIADRLKISKAEMLNPEADNTAVRLALAETHVIQETKKYLEEQGVSMDAFTSGHRQKRSDATILVKNIPYGTSSDQLRDLFSPHGEIARLIIPPAGTMAVVEFVHGIDAKSAFRAVAYKRLKDSIIYLEMGPIGMFDSDTTADGAIKTKTADGFKPITITEQEQNVENETAAATPGTTLFVKNLSFGTTTEKFTNTFRALPGFSFARVQTKPDPKRSDLRLSMGYGFIGFKTPESAKRAMKGMQGYVLDGHALAVKFAQRGGGEDEEIGSGSKGVGIGGIGKARSAKMIVKNVPFEATRKDLRELFSAHGQVKSVRLPRKFDFKTRGYAFVEFASRQDAENAMAALKHTHLLGRHLVLQFSEDGDVDVDELREKTRVGYGRGEALPGQKRKLDLLRGGATDENEDVEFV